MTGKKGADLEELVRAYFSRQGFFTIRSVSLHFEDEEVTEIDVWSYGRQSASIRTRTLIDVKDKRSPKAFERILWARGMQLALGCDRAVVATTDNSQKVVRFAQQQKVGLLSKQFLDRLQSKMDISDRLTLEEFLGEIRKYPHFKHDGDWIRKISDAKSAVISLSGYRAFNRCTGIFSFFAERVQTRHQHREQALRCAYFVAALSCVALDVALEQVLYEESSIRYNAIATGVTYGDGADPSAQKSIDTVLSVIAEGMANGRVIARQAKDALQSLFENVRADIIAEYFAKEHNASSLFAVARELEDHAHRTNFKQGNTLSIEAKSVLGVLADFVRIKRNVVLGNGVTDSTSSLPSGAPGGAATAEAEDQTKLI